MVAEYTPDFYSNKLIYIFLRKNDVLWTTIDAVYSRSWKITMHVDSKKRLVTTSFVPIYYRSMRYDARFQLINWSTDQASAMPAQENPSSHFTSTREAFKIYLIIPVLVPIEPNNPFTRSPTLKPWDSGEFSIIRELFYWSVVFSDNEFRILNFRRKYICFAENGCKF